MTIHTITIEHGDLENDQTIILDERSGLQIEIIGFGTACYKWRVSNVDRSNPTYNPMANVEYLKFHDESGWFGPNVLGMAGVWYGPETFARCVDEFVNGQ